MNAAPDTKVEFAGRSTTPDLVRTFSLRPQTDAEQGFLDAFVGDRLTCEKDGRVYRFSVKPPQPRTPPAVKAAATVNAK